MKEYLKTCRLPLASIVRSTQNYTSLVSLSIQLYLMVLVVAMLVLVVLSSRVSSSSSFEADIVVTAKAGFARKLQSWETRGFPRIRPPTQGQPTRWLGVVLVVLVVEEEEE